MTTDQLSNSILDRFFKFPRGAQLLIAYALVNDQWELQLMKSDQDGQVLTQGEWLQEKPSTIRGFAVYEFSDDHWENLQSIREDILASISEEEMELFKARKSKAYPWLW